MYYMMRLDAIFYYLCWCVFFTFTKVERKHCCLDAVGYCFILSYSFSTFEIYCGLNAHIYSRFRTCNISPTIWKYIRIIYNSLACVLKLMVLSGGGDGIVAAHNDDDTFEKSAESANVKHIYLYTKLYLCVCPLYIYLVTVNRMPNCRKFLNSRAKCL